MCDLDAELKKVTEAEVAEKRAEIGRFFAVSGDSPSDPIARKPSGEQLDWAARVAAAQERLVKNKQLDALSYYYHGADGNAYEELQSGFIVGHSLLTAKGIPCAGEGDLKTNVAMKICDLLGKGGSFTEIVAMDYVNNTMLMGHDGPFHISISDGRPVLRGMGVFHGKRGAGVSVEAQTHVDFGMPLDDYMDEWIRQAPTHHCALSVGHNAALFEQVADLLNVECVRVGK